MINWKTKDEKPKKNQKIVILLTFNNWITDAFGFNFIEGVSDGNHQVKISKSKNTYISLYNEFVIAWCPSKEINLPIINLLIKR